MVNKIKVSEENLDLLDRTAELLKAIMNAGDSTPRVEVAARALIGAMNDFEKTTSPTWESRAV